MRRMVGIACCILAGCVAAAAPATVRLGEDTCAHCHMTVIATATAAQVIAPGEEPVIVDDLGCLRDYLAGHVPAAGARVFVTDHRTGMWFDASSAVFTRTKLATPMSSGIVAHDGDESRRLDTSITGDRVEPRTILRPERTAP